MSRVLVTGGGGYVGAALVPALLGKGYQVRVLDLFFFGDQVLNGCRSHPQLEIAKGDLRSEEVVTKSIRGCDAVIHLACISNDPSFELNPVLGRAINYDAFEPLVRISKSQGVRRFIYASTSSVYGVSDAKDVTEEHLLRPITDYSRYKALCEPVLLERQTADFIPVVVRPATVCGYSPRQRLDLTVNILTNHAVNTGRITVFGGDQIRPNIHIQDAVDVYILLLEADARKVAGKIFNAGYENQTVSALAAKVRSVVQQTVPGRERLEIVTTPSDDHRSYHISSEKIKKELGFVPRRSIEQAVYDLAEAFQTGKIPNPMTDPRYYNIKQMQQVNIS